MMHSMTGEPPAQPGSETVCSVFDKLHWAVAKEERE